MLFIREPIYSEGNQDFKSHFIEPASLAEPEFTMKRANGQAMDLSLEALLRSNEAKVITTVVYKRTVSSLTAPNVIVISFCLGTLSCSQPHTFA